MGEWDASQKSDTRLMVLYRLRGVSRVWVSRVEISMLGNATTEKRGGVETVRASAWFHHNVAGETPSRVGHADDRRETIGHA